MDVHDVNGIYILANSQNKSKREMLLLIKQVYVSRRRVQKYPAKISLMYIGALCDIEPQGSGTRYISMLYQSNSKGYISLNAIQGMNGSGGLNTCNIFHFGYIAS